jgi:hypothetical protein
MCVVMRRRLTLLHEPGLMTGSVFGSNVVDR